MYVGVLYPRMTAVDGRSKGLLGASPGCRNGPEDPAHSKLGHQATPPGPASRPRAADHGGKASLGFNT